MSQLQALRSASSLQQVADLLQFKPKALAYILYKKPALTKYTSFTIGKRGGGTRQILAPCPELKLLQRRLSVFLLNCVDEINEKRKSKDYLAHGFKRKRSIITNATKHRKRRFVFNIDLKDFFPSINFGRVRGFFIKDANFLLHEDVATVLAQIACFNNGLPQGSPCSPVISNLIGNLLDIHLCRLASDNGCTYSRYADDITFSTNKPDFPPRIAKPVAGDPHVWEVSDDVLEIISHAKFAINPRKTRMQYDGSRQEVTGLVVNRKVNVRSDYRRTVRAMAQRLFMTGDFETIRNVPDATGVLQPTKVRGAIPELQGMLGHIDAVDRHNALIELKGEAGELNRHRALRSKEKVYRRFLIYKDFYAAPTPVIFCEGKTDNVYLFHAIRSLAKSFPKLATVGSTGEIKFNVRILKTQSRTGELLQLGRGSSDQERFIGEYLSEIERFKAPGCDHAVILFVDNDNGIDQLLKTIAKITNKKPTRTEEYVHISRNLYLVMTPLGGGAQTTIEDFFPDVVKKVSLGGKTFNPKPNADPVVHFGKAAFAKHVSENASKIDFAGFTDLLARITAAIEAHYAQLAVPVAIAQSASTGT